VAKPKVSRESEETGKDSSVVPAPTIDDDVEVKELYDLRNDPGETRNLYESYPDIVKLIMKRIEHCRVDIGDAFGKVDDPKPLTTYDENHPYIIAMYDKTEVG
jgi:hypothetical protein